MIKSHLKKAGMAAVMVFLATAGLYPAPLVLSPAEGQVPVQVRKPVAGQLTLEIHIPQLILESVVSPAGDSYTQIRMEGQYTTREPGHPELPVIRRLIRVPADRSLSVTLDDSSQTSLLLSSYALPNTVWPVQPSLPKRPDVKPIFQNPDIRVYNQKTRFPAATLTDLGILRQERIYRLDVYPVNYDPQTGRLDLRKSLSLTLTESPGKVMNTPAPSPLFSKLTAPLLSTSDEPPSLIQSPPGYLIVTPSQFEPALEEFITWKTRRGFQVDVLILESLGNPDTATIRDAIHDRYLNPPPGHTSPSFLLLVGDEEHIPVFMGKNDNHFTDLPYVTVTEGDYLPDMYTGRLAIRSVTELTHHLNKILWVEKYTYNDPSHLNNVMLIAGWDANNAKKYGYPAVNYARDHYLNTMTGFNTYSFLSSQAGEFTTAVRNRLNTGHSLIYYTGHGSATSWQDPAVSTIELANIQSYNAAPLVITNGCQTSNFAIDNSFSETLARMENKGASAVIGATNDSYWDADLWWAVGLYTIGADGRTPTPEETGTGMFDIPFTRTDLDNPSALIYAGNLAVLQAGSSLSRYYWEVYELFGDPSMTLRFGESEPLAVFSENHIAWSAVDFSVDVNGIPYALAALSRGDSLIAAAYTDDWGLATLTFPPLNSLEDLRLTVTAPGFIPYEKIITVIEPSQLIADKDTLAILTADTLTVTIQDPENNPLKNMEIFALSPGYASDTVLTDVNGHARLFLTVPYGPTLTLFARDPAAYYPLRRDTLIITGGQDFTAAELHLSSQYGVKDSLLLRIPFTLTGWAADTAVQVWYTQDGLSFSGGNDTLSVETNVPKPLFAAITAPGYNTYHRTFPLVSLFTNLSGSVTDTTGVPVPGAEIRLEGNNYRTYTFFTDDSGAFRSANPLYMEPLDLHIRAFGYEKTDTLFIPRWPDDSLTLELKESPRRLWIARVYDIIYGKPLEAQYRLYIGNSDSLYAEGVCTSAPDSNLQVLLPDYNYTLLLTLPGYVPIRQEFNTNEAPYTDFPMSLRSGYLVINDDSPKRYKDKHQTIPLLDETSRNSAFLMADILRDAGLSVSVKNSTDINPSLLSTYNGVIYSRGADQQPVTSTIQTALKKYLDWGGPLLIEGGELAYKHYEDDFGRDVLHISNWIFDKGGAVTITPEGRDMMQNFYPLPGELEHTYSVYGDQDVVEAAPGVVSLGSWSERDAYSSLLLVPDTLTYMSFHFASLNRPADRHHLLWNLIRLLPFFNPHIDYAPYAWIDTYEVPINDTIVVDPLETAWDPDGDSLTLGSVYINTLHGSYTSDSTGKKIIYTAPAYSGVSDTLFYTVSDGKYTDEGMIILTITGNNPPSAVTLLDPPDYYINRDSSSVILRWSASTDPDPDTLSYLLGMSQYDGLHLMDTLLITQDTLLRVFPADLGFAPDLSITWQVRVTDGRDTSRSSGIRHFTMDSSAFNALDPEDLLPVIFSAGPNYPNPFNPMTTIPLALPDADEVTLTIFNLRGARIRRMGPFAYPAGYHQLVWDGRDEQGHNVGTGLYIGKIQTRCGHTSTLKMIHLK
ncbi:MAG: lysine-specific cysteine proteinase Kgp [Marinimicrobia bacterium 46_43]|nr:MAG: lysine-specific cysteine proteinase Kgp [Marinimicrobia bacterium 46_43]